MGWWMACFWTSTPRSLITLLHLPTQWQGELPRPTPRWVGPATLRRAYLGKGRGEWDGGWHVFKLSFDVEWNGHCFQTLKCTSRGSNTRFLALLQ